jgi:hypothetical protein
MYAITKAWTNLPAVDWSSSRTKNLCFRKRATMIFSSFYTSARFLYVPVITFFLNMHKLTLNGMNLFTDTAPVFYISL